MAISKDLTVGEPSKVLRAFCLPMLGSIIFQQLYNLADSFVAGKLIGEEALAAVGNSYEITLIFIAFAFGCNIGCSVTVSQLFGAKKISRMKTAVYTALIASGAVCALLMAGGLLTAEALLRLIQTPENILPDSLLYLNIYIFSLPFVFFYNVSTGIFAAVGDSKTPFIFLAVSSSANIAADILFTAAFGMGVAGIAWATFICQGISCILAVIFVLKRLHSFETDEPVKPFSAALLKKIASVAVPSILQQGFVSVGNILIQGVINGFGSGIMAGYAASIKLNNLVITSLLTLGNGVSNFTAQNIGAGKTERIREGFGAALKLVLAVAVPAGILYFLAGEPLMRLFMDNPTDTALQSGALFLRIVTPFYPIASLKLAADGVLRGSGMMAKFMAATFTDLVLRTVLAFVLSGTFGSTGIWAAWPVGWTIAAVMSVIFYYKRFGKKKAD